MSDPLFERYKEALKAGHVAVLRGRLEDALTEYRSASAIAEERPLPHASMGGVLLRLGRAEEALACYDDALRRAPDYEVAVAGRAEALVACGRNAEAADALDRLAELRLATGQHDEAREALRRAVALHDTDARRRHADRVERLIDERRLAPPGPGEEEPEGRVAVPDAGPTPWPGEVGEAAAAAAAGDEGAVLAEPGPADAEPEPEAVPAEPTAAAELAEADALAAAGNTEAAVAAYVRVADALRAAGSSDAAIDACQQALDLAPDSVDVHLTLVQVYLDTGSRDLAAEKLLLLGRLIDLDGSLEDRERVTTVVREAFPADPRFAPPGS